jgi:hypothetical protein
MALLARSLARHYDALLTRHRLITTTASGSVLGCAGDAVAQHSQKAASGEDYDLERGLAFTAFGGIFTGSATPLNWTNALAHARACPHVL